MELSYRPATIDDRPAIDSLIEASFEPITWFRKIDLRFGPPGGRDWHARWRDRMDKIWASQLILVGEADGEIVAAATGTYDAGARLGYVDLLAVSQAHQGKGLGRNMLHAMLDHFRSLGAEHAHLECLADNDTGNALYRAEGFTEVARSIRWWLPLKAGATGAAEPQ